MMKRRRGVGRASGTRRLRPGRLGLTFRADGRRPGHVPPRRPPPVVPDQPRADDDRAAGPDCDLRIPLTDVSRKHCRLKLDAAGLLVSDLGSSNGTWVNGRRVTEEDLDPGDTLRVGPVKFTVQIDGKPALDEPPAEERPDDPMSTTDSAADESLALRPTAAAEVGDEAGSEVQIDASDEDEDIIDLGEDDEDAKS